MSQIPVATVIFLGITTVCIFAQTPANSTGDQSAVSGTQQSSSHTEETTQGEWSAFRERTSQTFRSLQHNSHEQFTGLLNGSGLISTDSENGLIFSAEAGGGWDSNPLNSFDSVSSSIYSISPYIAFHGASAKSKFIVQYQPTFIGYPSGTYEAQTLHAASVRADGSLSERVGWKMDINGNYGSNGARFAAPLQSVAVGEVPGTPTSSASYLPNSGSITYVFGSFETDYRKSERSTVAFGLWNSFNRLTGFDQAGGTVTGRLRYSYDLAPTLSLMVYAQASHFYGDLNCEGLGAGAGVDWRPGVNTTLSFEAGPQINTGACGDQQGYSYAVKYSTRLSNSTQFYLLANRLPIDSYLGPGVWQSGASAGMQYQVNRVALLHADVGYSSSSALTAVSSYRGFLINATYDVQLKHNLILSYGYRGYFADSAGTEYSRNQVRISLRWISNSGKVFQDQ